MEDIIKALTPLIRLIIGGVIGGFVTTYFDYRKQIIHEVWKKRFEQYKKLWAISGNLPKWPKDDALTFKKLHNICIALKNWYFNDGGLLLSKKSRDYYELLQEGLVTHADRESEEIIPDSIYKIVRQLFSDLRKQMTKDLSSRSRKLVS